jgi:hypothetical protein
MNGFNRNVQGQYCVLGQAALGLQDHDPAVKTAIFLEWLILTLNSEQYSHFAVLLLSNIVMYSWRLTYKYYENFHNFILSKKINHA